MHLFLIRHGETEHNIAGLLAGVTDSRLTNHGVIQTQRLGANLVKDRGLRFTNVYSSDLQRAFLTANEICKAQNDTNSSDARIEVVKLEIIREQDFGSLELVAWSSRRVEDAVDSEPYPDFKPKETSESMRSRAGEFLRDYMEPLLSFDGEEPSRVAIVSHGIFLANLWRTLLAKFGSKSVTIGPDVSLVAPGQNLERMSWSNTAYLELDIRYKPTPKEKPVVKEAEKSTEQEPITVYTSAIMTIKSINDRRHLLNLKRARGGIGSAAHDQRQQDINRFFKKRKLASNENSPPLDKG